MALDLFTVDLPDGTKAYVLAAIEHATRRIRILGATAHPGGQWIVQQAGNLCMDLDQAGANVKFVRHDRDATFHEGLRLVLNEYVEHYNVHRPSPGALPKPARWA